MGFWVSVLKSIGLAQNIQPIAHCNGLTGYQVRMGSIGLYQVESVYFKVIDSAALENITWKRNIYNFADKHNPTDAARDRKINIYTWHGRIFKEVMILLILQEYNIVNVKNLNSLSVRNVREKREREREMQLQNIILLVVNIRTHWWELYSTQRAI